MLEQKALELITNSIAEVLSGQNFSLWQSGNVEASKPSILVGEVCAYAVVYDKKQLRFELRQAPVEEGQPSDEWKTLSVWLFDSSSDTLKDAESIANDFADTLNTTAKKRQSQLKARKKEKQEEKSIDSIFYINRFITLFPDLKYGVQAHKNQYGDVLPVAFFTTFVLPEVDAALQDPSQKQKAGRLVELFEQGFKTGDLDVKSIVMMVLLNGLSPAAAETVEKLAGDALLAAWKHSRKFHNKNVKPEKVSKLQKLSAEKSSGSLY